MKGFFYLGLWALVSLLFICSGYPFQASLCCAFHYYPAAIQLFYNFQLIYKQNVPAKDRDECFIFKGINFNITLFYHF